MNKLYFLTLLVLLAQIGQTQAQRITLNVNNVSLDTVFARIQEQTPYRFVYTSEELAGTRKVSFSVQKAPINTVLNLSFKDQPLDYSMEDPYIYVRKKAETKQPPPPSNQTPEIRGKITNEQGDPLEGATVQINQLGLRTFTNAKGEFILRNMPNGNYELEITFIGYEKYSAMAKADPNSPPLTIAMKRLINNLDETVIKGYYNTTKRFNTGDVTTVKGEDIEKQPVSDPILALEGRVSGLYIKQASGIPGANSTSAGSIYLRGRNSIANGTSPLFIVDGVPFTSATLTNSAIGGGAVPLSPFNTIDPADIESIEVLKDADATAIYGSRGANGVILITTKKGRAGKTRFDVNIYSGAGKVSRRIPLLNTHQYLEMRREAFSNDEKTPGLTDYDVNGSWDTTRYTDWQKALIGGTAQFTKGEATISGGDLNTQFLMGVGYSKQTTVFPGNYNDQLWSAHLNVNHISSDKKFHATISASYTIDDNVIPTTDFTSQITLAPDAPPIYVGGNLNWQENSSGAYTFANPFAALYQHSISNTDNLIAGILWGYELLPGLQISSRLGYDRIEMNQNLIFPLSSYQPAYAIYPSLRENNVANNTLKTWIIEPQLNYKRQLLRGEIDIALGTTIQENNQTNYSLFTDNYPSDALINDIAAAAYVSVANYSNTQYKYNAVYGRLGYNWQEKYLLNITARRDGSSRFGPGHQFGDFGAVGIGWIFSKEKFVEKMSPVLNFGKLKASYGSTGNDQISDYQYLSSYTAYNFPYQGITGLYPTRIPNPYFRWEVVKKLEIGLDLGFIKNRILLNANYYINHTGNQLVGYSLATLTGFGSVTANLPANIENNGLELNLSIVNITGRYFTWNTAANVSFPKNKLIAYPNLAGSSFANTYTIGHSLFSSKGYHYTGVDPMTGIYTFEDVNKDGSITYPQDLVTMKPVTQTFYGGITNSVRYKSIALDILVQFVNQTGYNYSRFFQPPGAMANEPTYVLNRWQKSGDITNVQKFSQNDAEVNAAFYDAFQGDYPIRNASFIRLKNLSLSYDFSFCKKKSPSVKIYLQGQNLFTITKYQGLDPEASGGLILPTLRMIVGGVKIGL